MERLTIQVQERKEKKSKILRQQGYIPALLYNHGKTDHIQVNEVQVKKLFEKGVTESTLIDLKINEAEAEPAFIKDYQVHPISQEILHIDFFRVTFGEKVRTHIPLELKGKPVGVREGGVLETFIHNVEIETYPRHLVSVFEIDISDLKIGDSVHIRDVGLPPDTKILMEGNPSVCQVSTSAKLESQISIEPTEQEGEEEQSEEETKE